MTFHLGLTGSIGMGKSTTARLFAEQGCAVWDADAAVHRIYSPGGRGVEPIKSQWPSAILDGSVSRDVLRALIADDPLALARIEAIVHPLVADDRAEFIADAPADILVFDTPLLYETGGDKEMDAVACVTVPPEVQRERVLERGTMTAEDLDRILARQMPNEEKTRRADYVIVTDTMDHARAQVKAVVREIRQRLGDA